MKKNLLILSVLLTLSMATITEARTVVYIGSSSGRWDYSWITASGRIDSGRVFISTGFPYWWGHTGFNIGFSKRIDGSRIYFGTSLPFFWHCEYGYYGYYYPYHYYRDYRKIIVNNPQPIEDTYSNDQGSSLRHKEIDDRGRDVIFYGGIQIHPAGRIKIIANTGESDKPEVADIEIDGLPAGKTGDKPFEMGILVGKHKVSIKKNGKEVFSAEIDVERNKETSLKIDLESLMSP